MNTSNRYEEIVERNTVRRARDLAFALVLAAVAAFSIGSITSAARHVAEAPAAQAAQPAQVAGTGTCALETAC